MGSHASNIYRKLRTFDKTWAVIYALREGLIKVTDLERRPRENRRRGPWPSLMVCSGSPPTAI